MSAHNIRLEMVVLRALTFHSNEFSNFDMHKSIAKADSET